MLTKVFLAVALVTFATAVQHDSADYYWMPFTGEAPADVFMAACDDQQVPVYLGRAKFPLGVLPGTMHNGDKTLTVTAEGEIFSTDSGIRVMCTNKPDYYEWVEVKSWSDLPQGDDVHFVESGHEPGITLRTARIQHEGGYIMGKVYYFSPARLEAQFVYNGKGFSRTAFEILVRRDTPVKSGRRFECRH